MVSNSKYLVRCESPFCASRQIFIIDGVGEASNRSIAIDHGRRWQRIVLDILFTA
jgi:hypothetical protein